MPYLIKTSKGENTLMIGTDYCLGGRFHPQIAWAKLRALRDGGRSRARSCGVEFKVPVRDEQNKKQERLELN